MEACVAEGSSGGWGKAWTSSSGPGVPGVWKKLEGEEEGPDEEEKRFSRSWQSQRALRASQEDSYSLA